MLVKLPVLNLDNFKIACEATDIVVKQEKSYGKKTVVIVSVKHASQLYEAGLIEASIPSDSELKAAITESENKATLQGVAKHLPEIDYSEKEPVAKGKKK
jgi:hypothetical protein